MFSLMFCKKWTEINFYTKHFSSFSLQDGSKKDIVLCLLCFNSKNASASQSQRPELSLRWWLGPGYWFVSPLSQWRHTDNQRAELQHHRNIENNVKSIGLCWDEKTEHFMIDQYQLWMMNLLCCAGISKSGILHNIVTLPKIEDGRCDV